MCPDAAPPGNVEFGKKRRIGKTRAGVEALRAGADIDTNERWRWRWRLGPGYKNYQLR